MLTRLDLSSNPPSTGFSSSPGKLLLDGAENSRRVFFVAAMGDGGFETDEDDESDSELLADSYTGLVLREICGGTTLGLTTLPIR